MLTIGTQTLATPLIQAPMAGFTNDAFRRILLRFGGVGLFTTEMMHARGSLEMERRRKTLHGRLFGLPRKDSEEENPFRVAGTPLAVQIWDREAAPLAEFAQKLVEEYDIQIIDLNFGCPAPDVVQKAHSGAWLMQFPDRIGELTRAVVRASGSTPVTAKIRLGFSQETVNACEVAQILEEAGVSAITVHGRTAEQMYTGRADWSEIQRVKRVLKRVPLIGNGDISSAAEGVERLRTSGADGLMIGRAALKEPWIFAQTAALLRGETYVPPTVTCQKQLLLEHLNLLLEQHEEHEAVVLMRRYAPCYGAGLPNARRFRIAVGRAETSEEFRKIVANFFPESENE